MAFFFKVEERIWGKSCLELSIFVFVFAWKIHRVGSIAASLFHVPLLGILEDMYVKRYQEKD